MIENKPFYKRGWFITVVVIAVVLIGLIGGFIKSSNSMATSEQGVEEQLGQVQTVLQRRADLIPNLMNAVKGQQKQEKQVYGDISKARTEYYNAKSKYNNSNNSSDKVNALSGQDRALNVMVGSIREAYPKLESNSNMQTLMVQLEGSENRISVERNRYNKTAREYNNKLVKFPGSLVASITNHKKANYFQADESAQKAPSVNF
ncbi:LemA family protein [Apilactobacillus micheneri]|uniref:LemA family protein n=1 Tax=Apilactobacillus micheneri TaxID=1899430 RepID=UPI0011294C19|nr:LemA family protein [Apilactobacillus micheneri]TPR50398.1 LemA family protein [Apilactobacillus micheneri]